MAVQLRVEPFGAAHADEAGALLADRHRRARGRHPILPNRFESAGACADLLRGVMSRSSGVAASRDGQLLGFLLAANQLVDPRSATAGFAPERGAMMFVHGHAVGIRDDYSEVYAELYAAVAQGLIEQGILDHTAHIPEGDRALEEAWADLGFGRANVVAARDTEPVDRASSAVVTHRATVEDLDRVMELSDEEARYHARGPIFRPYVAADTAEAMRAERAQALAADDQVWFIGRVDGVDAGIIHIGPGRGSPLFIPDQGAYIGVAAVLPAFRGRGVGATLVDSALRWAHDRGYVAVTLHYAAANLTSTAFWTGLGFVPVMRHLRRRVDGRITWATPRSLASA